MLVGVISTVTAHVSATSSSFLSGTWFAEIWGRSCPDLSRLGQSWGKPTPCRGLRGSGPGYTECTRPHAAPRGPTHLSSSPLKIEKGQVRPRLGGRAPQHLGGPEGPQEGKGGRGPASPRPAAPRATGRCAPPPRAAPGHSCLRPERPSAFREGDSAAGQGQGNRGAWNEGRGLGHHHPLAAPRPGLI